MPFLVKKFAILLLYFLTSEKVKVCFSSSSFVQIKAIFSGSISAYLSITSNPKLKLSGYVILKFYIHNNEITLNEGDSIFFDSSHRHAMVALNDKKAKFLAIIM